MSVEKLPLGLGNISVEPGTHIAFPYRDEQERASFLLAYLKAGLENGEKCLAAILEYTPEFWIQGLADLGIDAKALLGKQLIILGPTELTASGKQGILGIPKMLARMADEATEQGWKALRICSGLTSVTQKPDMLSAILEEEMLDDRLLDQSGALLVCTFGEHMLQQRVLDLCLMSHPYVIAGAELRRNPEYVKPDLYARELPGMLQELKTNGELTPPFASVDFSGEIPVLKITGDMDVFTAPQLEDLGRSMAMVGHKLFVIDLSRAPFLDAAAISTMLRLNNIVRSKGGRLVVYDPEEPLRRIFQIIRLDQVIPVRHSCEQALQEVRK